MGAAQHRNPAAATAGLNATANAAATADATSLALACCKPWGGARAPAPAAESPHLYCRGCSYCFCCPLCWCAAAFLRGRHCQGAQANRALGGFPLQEPVNGCLPVRGCWRVLLRCILRRLHPTPCACPAAASAGVRLLRCLHSAVAIVSCPRCCCCLAGAAGHQRCIDTLAGSAGGIQLSKQRLNVCSALIHTGHQPLAALSQLLCCPAPQHRWVRGWQQAPQRPGLAAAQHAAPRCLDAGCAGVPPQDCRILNTLLFIGRAAAERAGAVGSTRCLPRKPLEGCQAGRVEGVAARQQHLAAVWAMGGRAIEGRVEPGGDEPLHARCPQCSAHCSQPAACSKAALPRCVGPPAPVP